MSVTSVDIYKRLPQTNCGRCGSPSCFVFATKVALKQDVIEKCVVLSGDEIKELKTLIGEIKTVMKEPGASAYAQAADEIKERIKDIDFEGVAEGVGAQYIKKDYKEQLAIVFLNHNYLISKDGEVIRADGQPPTAWAKIFINIYINARGKGELKNEWISFGGLPNTFAKQKSFKDNSEDILAKEFAGKKEMLKAACEALGGIDLTSEFNCDIAYKIPAFPKIPFLLLFWDAISQEGFPARVKILMDKSVLTFIDIESLVFLAERLAKELARSLEAQNKT